MINQIKDCLKNTGKTIDQIAKELNITSSSDFIKLTKEINKLVDEKILFESDGVITLASIYEEGIVDVYKSKVYIDDKPVKNDTNIILLNSLTFLVSKNFLKSSLFL